MKLTNAEYEAYLARRLRGMAPPTKKPSNRGNIKAEIDGIVFDSIKEARRYKDLKLLQAAGEISELQTQVPYDIVINNVKVCTYIADFVYLEKRGVGKVVEDAKGYREPIYRLKAKLMRAVHGVVIRET